MKKKPSEQSFLLKKKDIVNRLGCSSMKTVYSKILTTEIIKELGFKSIDEFKKIRTFSLHQSRVLDDFLNSLLDTKETD